MDKFEKKISNRPSPKKIYSEFLIVAEKVLLAERRPMTVSEITQTAYEKGLFSDKISGKTPFNTLKSKLCIHIKKKGDSSRFIRTAPGKFYLRIYADSSVKYYSTSSQTPLPANERVLVFPSSWLDKEGRFQGILKREDFIKKLVSGGTLTYIDRQDAEMRDDYKQIVTYTMVTRANQILSFKRGQYSRAEDFLKGAYCVGFGGHVNERDRDLFSSIDYGIRASAIRELSEEIRLPADELKALHEQDRLAYVGILNDDSSPNGRRHLAVLFRYEAGNSLEWSHPKTNERSVTQLRWLDPDSQEEELFGFEYWSQLCLLAFYRKAEITKPTFKIRKTRPLRPPHLLVLLGHIGSGKTEATNILRTDYSYTVINSGQVLAKELGVSFTSEAERANFQKIAWEFITKEDGPSRLARALWEESQGKNSSRILLDGIRQEHTLENLKLFANGRKVGVLYIHTLPNVAYEFYKERADTKDVTFEDFLAVRNAAVEQEIDKLIAHADAVVYNWKGRTPYRQAIHALMRKLGVQP